MKNMYGALAPFYDRLGDEIDYVAWADFIEENFRRYFPGRVDSVLDLACGTGRMTKELCLRGYDMIGVDLSPEMLSVARQNADKKGIGNRILYLCQDMCNFELYGTVDAVVCCLDAVNHITNRADLSHCFGLVHNYLSPGGLFLFDVNSPYKFETVYGDNTYVLEDKGVFCAWQNRYYKKSRLCDFCISLFREQRDGTYIREDVIQRERSYPLSSIKKMLKENGLELLSVSSGFAFEAPNAMTERYYIAARAVKEDL